MKNNFLKSVLLFFSLSMLSGHCIGQVSVMDSLLSVYSNDQLPASERIHALMSLGASDYAREKPDSILHYYSQAKALIRENGSDEEKHLHTYFQGVSLYRLSRYGESLSVLNQAREMAQENNDTVQIIKSLNYSANSYLSLSDFSTSLEKYMEGLQLSEALGNKRFIVTFESGIGLVYLAFHDYEKAREYFNKALQHFLESDDSINTIRLLTNIGVSYKEEKNFERSLKNHLRAYELAEKHNFERNIGSILLNIGDCYLNLGDTLQAKDYLKRGMLAAKQQQEPTALARGSIQMAHLYRYSNADSAAFYGNEGLEIARQVADQTILRNALQINYLLSEDKKQYKDALSYHKEWIQVRDTIFSEESKRALYESEAKYEYEKQKLLDQIVFDKELANQRLQARTNTFIILSITVLLIIGLLSIIFYRKKRNEKERASLEHELEMLKERIAVHAVSLEGVRKELELDREAVETYLGKSLGDSSWNILCTIFDNPSISNREIAEKVFLSLEGVSSSLRRMYQSFEVTSDSSQNLKIALLTKVVKISFENLPKTPSAGL